ncbi:hypothetical protein [Flagellimonas nanhaiensis]|uniref:Uncharacterized protein n=1 Tax=Flagellimonas nanhaiensis TaxID=2292706 RepID=A0A371JU41_9FLAO|nr:hypothetical protein [Allomuricauda nanhaiensis]RDY61314.1 hypothetical protein DX873_03875 [Allomuricauda nanhaiensis]
MIPTTFEKFQETLKEPIPSNQWPAALKSLWWDAKGDWNASHDIAQEIHTPMGSWIHAYLHRKEGDEWNAGYWYRQAGQPFPKYSLEEEFKILVEENLS